MTYCVVREQLGWADEYSFLEKFERNGTLHDDSGYMGIKGNYGANNEIFYWVATVLCDHKILKGAENAERLKIVSPYKLVKERFRTALQLTKDSDREIFPCFSAVSSNFLPSIENVTFSIEGDCKPLIEKFCSEGFMTSLKQQYCWTEKIRPLMEALGRWKTIQDIQAETNAHHEKIELNRLYLKKFNESLEQENIEPILNFCTTNQMMQDTIQNLMVVIGKSKVVLNSPNSSIPTTLPFEETKIRSLDFWDAIGMFEGIDLNATNKDKINEREYCFPWFG